MRLTASRVRAAVKFRLKGSLRLGALIAFLALLVLPATAAAHALPQSSVPAANAELATAPDSVTIRFGERPDPKLSSIRVLDSTGASQAAGPTAVVTSDPLSLSVPLAPLGSGVYTVAWRTVSAVDGHLASGTFAFGVGEAVPAGGGSGGATSSIDAGGGGSPSPDAIAVRWLFLAGVILLVGVGVSELAVFRVPTRSGARLAATALVAAAAGAAGILVAEVADAGIAPADALASSLGGSTLLRLAPLVAAAAGLLVAWRAGRRRERSAAWRWGWCLAIAGGAGAMLADVLASHAAAAAAPLVNTPVQAVHVVAAGVWIGGLAGLVAGLRGAPQESRGTFIRRFSRLATVSIGVVVVTGVLRAIAELSSLQDLVGTDFGRLLLVKSALVGVLAALGAVNHFRHVPLGGLASGGVRRIGSLELSVAAGVLLATAALVNVAPPVELAAAGASAPGAPAGESAPLQVAGNDFGTSVRVKLSISPGSIGFNTFTADVSDYDSGTPLDASGVTLRFSLPARPDLGGSTLELAPQQAGTFSAQGANLSLTGSWALTALVDRGAASVEVPLAVRLRPPVERTDVDSEPGTPTLYTVHLDAGRSVEVYLDPGTAGSNDVHATFFDATGTELPVIGATTTVTPAVSPSAAPDASAAATGPRQLQDRMLEPGHFIGTTVLAAGSWEVEVVGPAPDGTPLDADLVVSVTP